MYLVPGGAFCLLSVFCALMMYYFDRRAQRILRRDEATTGSQHVIITLLLIVTDILSRTVSELSQLIVQISNTLRFRATHWELRDNVRLVYECSMQM